MKKYYLIFASFISTLIVNAQLPIYSAIGPNFIQGVTNVTNQFYVDATTAPPGTVDVNFYITGPAPSYTPIYMANVGAYDGTNQIYYFDYDMGSLPSSTPSNIVAWAEYVDGSNTILNYSDDYIINLIPSPAWLNSNYQGQLSGLMVDYNNNNFSVHGSLPLSQLVSNKTVTGIIGLGGKSFKVLNPNIDFDIVYDMQTGNTSVSQTTLTSDFKALNDGNSPISNTSFSSSLSFDANFNLTFNGVAIWEPAPIIKAYEFKNVPLIGANVGIVSFGSLCVNTSFEFSLAPKIKAQIYAGLDASTGQWGFLSNGSDVTQLLAKVRASATARGELKAVCGSFLGFNLGLGTIARGQVTATLTVGAGVQYSSMPSTNINPVWAGDFEISAYGEVLGFGNKSGSYHPTPWGNASDFNYKVQNQTNDFFSASTFKIPTPPVPNAWPMGEISTRDSILAAGWLDNINFGGNTSLLVSYYNPVLDAFSTPVIVAQNDSGITNHSIALLPNKDILITWSQLNQKTSSINTSTSTLDDISQMQDIWFAIVDPFSNSLIYKGRLTDASGNRADGEPRIHWGNANDGMLTWQVGDNANSGSDIYFSKIHENSGVYSFDNPQILNNSSGFNYGVNISYSTGNNAIATWFNDPDMDQLTLNTEIYYSLWDGSSWSAPSPRFSVPTGIVLKDYNLSTNGNYGIEGLTYEYYTPDSNLVNGVYLGRWTDGNPNSPFYAVDQEEDSTFTFQLPKVSVSQSGIASMILQVRDVYDGNDNGKLNLFMKDLNSAVAWQDVSQSNPSYLGFISDSTEFVWDMSSEYGFLQSANSSDIMYLFTQEMDSLGNTNPSFGQIFGNPNLNLVLRAFEVSSNGGNLTVSDVQEPNSGNITGFYEELKNFNYNFELKPNYPNPFSSQTTIPFHVFKAGKVKIEIYDLTGNMVGVILEQNLSPGDYQTVFECNNLESGVYYYKITHNGSSSVQKLVITK